MTPIYNVIFTVEKIQVHTKIKEQHNQHWSTPYLDTPTISHLAAPASCSHTDMYRHSLLPSLPKVGCEQQDASPLNTLAHISHEQGHSPTQPDTLTRPSKN